jgi:hypothetical protein
MSKIEQKRSNYESGNLDTTYPTKEMALYKTLW